MAKIDKSKLSKEGLSEYEYMMKKTEKEAMIPDIFVTLLSGVGGAVSGAVVSMDKKPLTRLIIAACNSILMMGVVGTTAYYAHKSEYET